jgi:hypothetical protein
MLIRASQPDRIREPLRMTVKWRWTPDAVTAGALNDIWSIFAG